MIKRFKDKKQFRLPWWDYSGNGCYMITICTLYKQKYFGKIRNGIMCLSEIGQTAYNYWLEIPNHFPFVAVDQFVIMPDHMHGILFVDKTGGGTQNFVFPQVSKNKQNLRAKSFGPQSENLSSVIRGYKAGVSCYAIDKGIDFRWQSRFHDKIIWNEDDLNYYRKYILNNSRNWKNG